MRGGSAAGCATSSVFKQGPILRIRDSPQRSGTRAQGRCGSVTRKVQFFSVFSGRSRHASRASALLVLAGSASAEIHPEICESLSVHDSPPERNGNLVSGFICDSTAWTRPKRRRGTRTIVCIERRVFPALTCAAQQRDTNPSSSRRFRRVETAGQLLRQHSGRLPL